MKEKIKQEMKTPKESIIKLGDKMFLSESYGDNDISNREYDYGVKKWEELKQKIKDQIKIDVSKKARRNQQINKIQLNLELLK